MELYFDDVEYVFKMIWCEERERYWYETAWRILKKHGLTSTPLTNG